MSQCLFCGEPIGVDDDHCNCLSVKGGQGRTSEEVRGAAGLIVWCLIICGLAFIALVVWSQL